MLSASECLLKAENFTLAASMAGEGHDRMVLLGAAAYWRNKAFDMQMERFRNLREAADGEEHSGDPALADDEDRPSRGIVD